MTCTFFGHTYPPAGTKEKIRKAVINLIENHSVDMFYVGNHGFFDGEVRDVLMELSKTYDIDYRVVLSKIPGENEPFLKSIEEHTLVPERLELILPKFRIIHRNRWMIKKSDYVITYIDDPNGRGAARFAAEAERRGKKIIKLGMF